MKSKTYNNELKLWDNVKLSNCLIIYIKSRTTSGVPAFVNLLNLTSKSKLVNYTIEVIFLCVLFSATLFFASFGGDSYGR